MANAMTLVIIGFDQPQVCPRVAFMTGVWVGNSEPREQQLCGVFELGRVACKQISMTLSCHGWFEQRLTWRDLQHYWQAWDRLAAGHSHSAGPGLGPCGPGVLLFPHAPTGKVLAKLAGGFIQGVGSAIRQASAGTSLNPAAVLL